MDEQITVHVNIVLHLSGHSRHEWISFSAMEDIFKFIQEKFDTATALELSNPKRGRGESFGGGAEGVGVKEDVLPLVSQVGGLGESFGGGAEGVGVEEDVPPLVSQVGGLGRLVQRVRTLLPPIPQWIRGLAAWICLPIRRFVCPLLDRGSAALHHRRRPVVSIALLAITIGLAVFCSSAFMPAYKEQGVDVPRAPHLQTTAPPADTGAMANATLSHIAVTLPRGENKTHSNVEDSNATHSHHITLNIPEMENETPSNSTATVQVVKNETLSHTVVTQQTLNETEHP